VVFLVEEDALEQVAGAVVAGFDGGIDGLIQPGERLEFKREVVLKLLLDVLTDAQGEQRAHIG
jgi:hypothetical protein